MATDCQAPGRCASGRPQMVSLVRQRTLATVSAAMRPYRRAAERHFVGRVRYRCRTPPNHPPIMFPFIIQLPQLPMCCSIQLTIWLHQPGEGVLEIEARESVSIH